MRSLSIAFACVVLFGIDCHLSAEPPQPNGPSAQKGAPIRKGKYSLSKTPAKSSKQNERERASFPGKDLIGRELTLVGRGENSKVGALLQSDDFRVWIDFPTNGIWPQEVYNRTFENPDAIPRKVKVTGKLEQWNDLPVFIPSKSPGAGGIPVPEGTNLEEARKRFILVDVKWEIVPEETELSTRKDLAELTKPKEQKAE